MLGSYIRASLDATQDSGRLLHEALGAKKLKELRRQRHRLEEHGPVTFDVARKPGEIKPALETFLQLESSGWKGERGTALIQDAGDATFIRRAVPALAETAQCEIVTLHAGATPVASGIVLRHQDRAFFFKLGIDERFAKYSPGVQLTLDLTRHLCADPDYCERGFHRKRGPSHDQSDLARPLCDRRRAHSAAAQRSDGGSHSCGAGRARLGARSSALRDPLAPQIDN